MFDSNREKAIPNGGLPTLNPDLFDLSNLTLGLGGGMMMGKK
jgi:hypothetical protein